MRTEQIKKPWLIWGIATCFASLQFLIQSCTAVLGEEISHEFHLSKVAIGWYASIYFITYISLQIPVGKFFDHYGARKLLLLSVPATLLLCVCSAITHNVVMSYCFRLLLGIVNTPAVVGTIYLANQWFEKHQYGMIVGLTELACLTGAGCGLKILSWITLIFHWHAAFLGCAIVCLFLWLLIYLFVFDNPDYHNKQNNSVAVDYANLFKTPGLLATGLFAGCSAAFLASFAGLWGVQYLEMKYHFDLITASNGPQLVLIGAGISSLLLGILSDKLGQRKRVMLCSTLLTILFFLIVLYSPLNSTLIFISLFFIGLSAGSYMLCFSIVKTLLPLHQQAFGIGFINLMTMVIGALILQPLIGWLLSLIASQHQNIIRISDFTQALSIIPIVLIVALCCLPFIKEMKS